MEAQCTAILYSGGYAGCARALAKVFSQIGDRDRAGKWMAVYRANPNHNSPLEAVKQ
jgi:hypothetical protein